MSSEALNQAFVRLDKLCAIAAEKQGDSDVFGEVGKIGMIKIEEPEYTQKLEYIRRDGVSELRFSWRWWVGHQEFQIGPDGNELTLTLIENDKIVRQAAHMYFENGLE